MSTVPSPRAAVTPDEELVRRASRAVGIRVALACAVLMAGGATVFFGYLWYRILHPVGDPAEAATTVTVSLDVADLATAAVLATVATVLLSGYLTVWFARSASLPLVDALRRQREFVANASHELRTPLTVLSARTQLLQARVGRDETLRPVADDLRRDADAMAVIVDDMLSVARLSDAPEGTCDVADAARRVRDDLALLHPERDVAVRAEVPSAAVAVPEAAVRRMLTALVDNALDFAPPGSAVTITGERAGDAVRVRVADAGAGIRGVDPDHVFDRFARGRPAVVPGAPDAAPRSSHGIGLALVRETARRYHGDAAVASTGPEGTVMLLTLPAVEGADGVRGGGPGAADGVAGAPPREAAA